MPSLTIALPKTLTTGILAAGLALSGATAMADDDFEPKAYLYNGTCANLANATGHEEIDDLDNDHDDDDSTRVWTTLKLDGTPSADAWLEQDDVDEHHSVSHLIDNDYAVVVHETEDTDSAVLACGDVEGALEGDSLLIQLNEVDSSGWEGRAHLAPDDDDDDIDISVAIVPAGSVEPIGTPAN